MASTDIRVHAEPLQTFMTQVFMQAGLPPEDAALESEVLIWANLRGVDSHGVLRIASYLAMIDGGDMNPRPQIKTLKETPAVLYLDADRAMGPIATIPAMRRVMAKAREVGIGWYPKEQYIRMDHRAGEKDIAWTFVNGSNVYNPSWADRARSKQKEKRPTRAPGV